MATKRAKQPTTQLTPPEAFPGKRIDSRARQRLQRLAAKAGLAGEVLQYAGALLKESGFTYRDPDHVELRLGTNCEQARRVLHDVIEKWEKVRAEGGSALNLLRARLFNHA